MSETWYLYDSGPNHPFFNMAFDEALLKRRIDKSVLLRLYAWDPPGLSLGYFQKYKKIAHSRVIQECGAVVTRRITGGDAILHIHELTFCLRGREDHYPYNGTVELSYKRIHSALARGFEGLGISAGLIEHHDLKPGSPGDPEGRCFYHATRYDLVSDSRKLVGSAQRRTLGQVMHHGTIPLAPNPFTPEAADLSSLAYRSVTYSEAAKAVKTGFETTFGVRFLDWKPDPSLIRECENLAHTKYSTEKWIQRR